VVVDPDDPLYGESYTSTSEKSADEFGAYLQGEVTIADPLEVVAGVRYDYHNSTDEFRGSGNVHPEGLDPLTYQQSSVNPRLAVKYSPLDFLALRASAGTGFKIPYGFSEDLHLCSGSPRVWKGADLLPERSQSFNLSADVNLDRFVFNLNLYRTNLADAVGLADASIEASALGYTYQWENVGDAYVQGIELGTGLSLFSFLGINADFAINDGKYADVRDDWVGTEFEDVSRYISRFPLNEGSISLDLEPGSWDISMEANYQGTMYIDYFADGEEPTMIKKTEPHMIFNARMSRGFFADKLSVYVGGKNLTDYVQPEKHTDDAAFIYAPVYGRILYGGIGVNF
jgi:outer membrane receptor for ferrienterochelin and colicins